MDYTIISIMCNIYAQHGICAELIISMTMLIYGTILFICATIDICKDCWQDIMTKKYNSMDDNIS